MKEPQGSSQATPKSTSEASKGTRNIHRQGVGRTALSKDCWFIGKPAVNRQFFL